MINKQIKVLRNNHNYTQEDLAEKLNVSRQTISKWELGTSEPDLNMIIRLSELFSVSTDYLILGSDYVESENEVNSNQNMNFWIFVSEKWWLVIIILLIICGTIGQVYSN
ncbi:helix-turn-helix domain-containing protein [Macrococcus epidermidis]|uniref:helix-turn-helix domain-containing protein n=1 Tax=Macrococcus epidermidis TaxID=1902580 RepID=UPI001EF340D6|nr:helix-turn-helix transcriptional regulator [Macrococcus epidermidis]MCG7419199.1 helix-turn-helix domain-containing protein [Macrococcus epidermidis]